MGIEEPRTGRVSYEVICWIFSCAVGIRGVPAPLTPPFKSQPYIQTHVKHLSDMDTIQTLFHTLFRGKQTEGPSSCNANYLNG